MTGFWNTARVDAAEIGRPGFWADITTDMSGGQARAYYRLSQGFDSTDVDMAMAVGDRVFADMVLDHNFPGRDGNPLAPASEGHLASDLPISVVEWLMGKCGMQIQQVMTEENPDLKNSARPSPTPSTASARSRSKR